MGLLDAVFGNEIDDPSILPMELVSVYQNPYRTLGLDETATIGQIRDSFRKSCMSLIDDFSGLHHPKITLMQIHVAYHLARKTLTGPATKLLHDIKESPYFQSLLSSDILPILRPVHSTFDCPSEYRGFRFFSIHCTDYRTVIETGAIPKTLYKFDVHYCMRKYTVEREYDAIYQLNQELAKELLLVPSFPTRSNLGTRETLGKDLAEYIRRVYTILSNKGLFSPRVLSFLSVPYEQVQSEEEGQIVQVLDGSELPPQTVWHIVEEEWLAKWRRFVLGRDARRYAPPGPVTNEILFDQDWVVPVSEKKHRRPVRAGLVIAKDYRVVNYNVWHFYLRVHGGGPTISRKYDDIYSPPAFSRLQALILIQGRGRCFIAKKKLDKLYTAKFSSSLIAKKIMTKASETDLDTVVKKRIQECSRDRVQDKLEGAARLTQNLWRNKKRYIPEENLARRKRDQEVFARARVTKRAEGVSEEAKTGEGLVVTDVHPIVHIGNSGMYTRTLTEEEGIPFSLAREPGSSMAIIDKKTPEESSELFKVGSKLIAINHIPTASLTYEETKEKLKAATFPLHLMLSYPANEVYVKKLNQLEEITNPELRYRAFKLLLAYAPNKDGESKNGIFLRKHDTKAKGYHDSAIYISETELFYKKKRQENPWVGISLYSLRYVRGGLSTEERNGRTDETPGLTARFGGKAGYTLNHFFELVSNTRSYYFEVLSTDQTSKPAAKTEVPPSSPAGSQRLRMSLSGRGNLFSASGGGSDSRGSPRAAAPSTNSADTEKRTKDAKQLVDGLKQLIDESKGSRWFVSKDGVPMRRARAKTTLRKIL